MKPPLSRGGLEGFDAKERVLRGTRHRRTLEGIFTRPTRGGIVFADIEALMLALGGEVREGEGSRIVFELHGKRNYLHRSHPGKEARKYQVEEIREWLQELEVIP